MLTTWSTTFAARWCRPAGRWSTCSPKTPRSKNIWTAPPWSGCATRPIIWARPAPWSIACWRCGPTNRPSLRRLQPGSLDDVRPFFGFVGQEFFVIGRRADHGSAAQFGEALLGSRFSQDGIDVFIEPGDDLGGRSRRHADAVDVARLVTRNELAQGGHLRKDLDARR